MKPPICKVCQSPHWTYEEHKATSALEEVRALGASVLRNTVTKLVPVLSDGAEAALAVRPMPNTAAHRGSSAPSPSAGARGRPKKHKTNAERQRAYRLRQSD